jgi:hypothetical protein
VRINSIVGSNQYDIHKELNNKYENKRRVPNKKQDVSFSDVLEQMKNNKYKMDKDGVIKQIK